MADEKQNLDHIEQPEGKSSLSDAIQRIKEGKKRDFIQSVDLIINLKSIDLKKPENNFSRDIQLPFAVGNVIKVCIISDTIKNEGIEADVVGKKDIEDMANDSKKSKTFVDNYQFFLCEALLMPLVGKILGRYMGPKGKMPKPLPPSVDSSMLKRMIESSKKSVRIAVRGRPYIHMIIGKENMPDKELEENVNLILEETIKSLPKGRSQIRGVLLKLTMGKPVKLKL